MEKPERFTVKCDPGLCFIFFLGWQQCTAVISQLNVELFCCSNLCCPARRTSRQDGWLRERRDRGVSLLRRRKFSLPGAESSSAGGASLHGDDWRREPTSRPASGEPPPVGATMWNYTTVKEKQNSDSLFFFPSRLQWASPCTELKTSGCFMEKLHGATTSLTLRISSACRARGVT